jgi:hypothetical protein
MRRWGPNGPAEGMGTLTLSDTGIFDTAAGRFSCLDEEAGGTGQFAGVTARLFIHGTGTTSFDSEVSGEVCLPS